MDLYRIIRSMLLRVLEFQSKIHFLKYVINWLSRYRLVKARTFKLSFFGGWGEGKVLWAISSTEKCPLRKAKTFYGLIFNFLENCKTTRLAVLEVLSDI